MPFPLSARFHPQPQAATIDWPSLETSDKGATRQVHSLVRLSLGTTSPRSSRVVCGEQYSIGSIH